MPKAPILSRFRLYERMRDGSERDLEWNVVNTSLGQMIEPRSHTIHFGAMPQRDPYDLENVNGRQLIQADQMPSLLGTGGDLWPRTYNTL